MKLSPPRMVRPFRKTRAGQRRCRASLPQGSDKGLPDDGEERSAAFSKVLGSYKQAQFVTPGRALSNVIRGKRPATTGQVSGSAAADQGCRAAEQPYFVRPEQVEKPAEPKRRTWRGVTRQTLWLLLILLACIVFFRIFGPERKKPTIEDFFRPGNPDIEFLDAINFLEKYYERQRKQQAANAGMQAAETSCR